MNETEAGKCVSRNEKPYVATLDQVRISREGEYGIIEYIESNVSGVQLKIGPKIQGMSDQEILDCHNRILRMQKQLALEYEHIAIEIPEGRPQIKYYRRGNQWAPRGDVLRWLLTTYAGWGMRIVFVPDDRTYEEPEIEIRDPDDANSWLE